MDTEHAQVTTRDERPPRPGWPEMVVAVVVFLVVAFGGIWLLGRLGADPGAIDLISTAWSGVAGIVGFLAAVALRIRSLAPFGIRRVSWRWVLVGVGAGVVAWLVSRVLALAYIAVTGPADDVQSGYFDAAGGGPVALVLSLLFLAVLTPLGEELVFRGVLTTGLLRYGVLVGVVGSSLVFALSHGLNSAFLTALVNGLIGAELVRRSGSVWPGVVSHAVNNGVGLSIGILAMSLVPA